MFIGEAPGEHEDRSGRPFVGPAGEKLDQMIKAMGFTREDVYIANVLKTRPPEKRHPTSRGSRGVRALARLPDRGHTAEGAGRAREGRRPSCMLGTDTGITRLRGAWGAVRRRGTLRIPVMPTYHPALRPAAIHAGRAGGGVGTTCSSRGIMAHAGRTRSGASPRAAILRSSPERSSPGPSLSRATFMSAAEAAGLDPESRVRVPKPLHDQLDQGGGLVRRQRPSMKLGRLPCRQSARSVNWLTRSTLPSTAGRGRGSSDPSSSRNTRRPAIFRASQIGVGFGRPHGPRRPEPESRSPRRPRISPSTSTLASRTRWITASHAGDRLRREGSRTEEGDRGHRDHLGASRSSEACR